MFLVNSLVMGFFWYCSPSTKINSEFFLHGLLLILVMDPSGISLHGLLLIIVMDKSGICLHGLLLILLMDQSRISLHGLLLSLDPD